MADKITDVADFLITQKPVERKLTPKQLNFALFTLENSYPSEFLFADDEVFWGTGGIAFKSINKLYNGFENIERPVRKQHSKLSADGKSLIRTDKPDELTRKQEILITKLLPQIMELSDDDIDELKSEILQEFNIKLGNHGFIISKGYVLSKLK